MNHNAWMQDRDTDGLSKEAIGKRLALTREILGLTQAEFADLCNISRNTYNQYERGVNRPPIDAGLVIRDKAGISLDWIYAGDPSTLRWDIANKIKEARAGSGRS